MDLHDVVDDPAEPAAGQGRVRAGLAHTRHPAPRFQAPALAPGPGYPPP
ncbi:hypothetical protein [Streptomyces avermitilis]